MKKSYRQKLVIVLLPFIISIGLFLIYYKQLKSIENWFNFKNFFNKAKPIPSSGAIDDSRKTFLTNKLEQSKLKYDVEANPKKFGYKPRTNPSHGVYKKRYIQKQTEDLNYNLRKALVNESDENLLKLGLNRPTRLERINNEINNILNQIKRFFSKTELDVKNPKDVKLFKKEMEEAVKKTYKKGEAKINPKFFDNWPTITEYPLIFKPTDEPPLSVLKPLQEAFLIQIKNNFTKNLNDVEIAIPGHQIKSFIIKRDVVDDLPLPPSATNVKSMASVDVLSTVKAPSLLSKLKRSVSKVEGPVLSKAKSPVSVLSKKEVKPSTNIFSRVNTSQIQPEYDEIQKILQDKLKTNERALELKRNYEKFPNENFGKKRGEPPFLIYENVLAKESKDRRKAVELMLRTLNKQVLKDLETLGVKGGIPTPRKYPIKLKLEEIIPEKMTMNPLIKDTELNDIVMSQIYVRKEMSKKIAPKPLEYKMSDKILKDPNRRVKVLQKRLREELKNNNVDMEGILVVNPEYGKKLNQTAYIKNPNFPELSMSDTEKIRWNEIEKKIGDNLENLGLTDEMLESMNIPIPTRKPKVEEIKKIEIKEPSKAEEFSKIFKSNDDRFTINPDYGKGVGLDPETLFIYRGKQKLDKASAKKLKKLNESVKKRLKNEFL